MKKIIFLLISLIGVTVVMTYLYFGKLKETTNGNDLALSNAIIDASIVFEFNNDTRFYNIMQEQAIISNVIGPENTRQMLALQDYFTQHGTLSKLLENNTIYGSLVGEKFFFAVQLKSLKDADNLSQIIRKKNTSSTDGNIIKINLSDSTSAAIGIKNQLVLIGETVVDVEKRIQLTKEKKAFKSFVQQSAIINKTKFLTVYADLNNLPSLLRQKLSGSIDGELNFIKSLNAFSELRYNFSKEKLLFHGTTILQTDTSYYALFSNIAPQKMSINNILPSSTANYKLYAVDNYPQWLVQLDRYFKLDKSFSKIENTLKLSREKYLLDLRKIFSTYFKGQMITFQLSNGEKLGAVSLSDGNKVKHALNDISTIYTEEIKVLKEKDLLYSVLGDAFYRFSKPFYVILDGYMIVANNAGALQQFLQSYNDNDLLVNTANYTNFRDQFSSYANLSFYVNLKNSKLLFGRDLKTPYYKHFTTTAGLKEFNTFCFQLSGDKGKFQTNIILSKDQSTLTDSTTVTLQ